MFLFLFTSSSILLERGFYKLIEGNAEGIYFIWRCLVTWFAYLPSPKLCGLYREIQMPANLSSANHIALFQGRKSIQLEVVNNMCIQYINDILYFLLSFIVSRDLLSANTSIRRKPFSIIGFILLFLWIITFIKCGLKLKIALAQLIEAWDSKTYYP